jgi:gamma-carbonic anhydrase
MPPTEANVTVGRNVYIAPTSYVGGDVTIDDDCTIMHHVTIRGDVSPIRIGKRVNIQDGSVIHTQRGVPLRIGDDVSIGHRAVVHCKNIGPGTLIGTGSIVLDDCEVGSGCIVGAGAVVTPKTIIPDHMVVMGIPAIVVREVKSAELEYLSHIVRSYMELGRLHAEGRYPAYQPR